MPGPCDEEDDGVPPCCRDAWCPLSHDNKWLNDNEWWVGGFATAPCFVRNRDSHRRPETQVLQVWEYRC